ncbi:hypothetical protein N7495_004285 [Penicillium taxi]|uniref:uncharacterized protein n=1 Tax=Penicillium taxi TaxID=168475 RepID=UPI0025452329|nr:uncharacterized protein N7495_004285 [Penicillium taxi]KAJ5899541.1 hypothetical protein N7495_004285 [Penicillium taxi]
MAHIKGLNAHDRPPEVIRQCYKKYSKISLADVDQDPAILDLQRLDPQDLPPAIKASQSLPSQGLRMAFDDFVSGRHERNMEHAPSMENIPIFTHDSITGLLMIPSLFPPTIQIELLSRLLHRDLSNPEHKTNLHIHYDVTYPEADDNMHTRSFFASDPALIMHPKDPHIHKPLTVQSAWEKKLRWVTLGGQYDWSAKVYPSEAPPPFPQDIANLLRTPFPETESQAAILNFYSPGDTLSVHRDVSEECDVGLISMSFGCDGLFLVSHDDGNGCGIIRIRSGDAVYMNGASRFAWHAVPKILPHTCPSWLADWPSLEEGSPYQIWKGWMSGKRVNLNVRQMTSSNAPENAGLVE